MSLRALAPLCVLILLSTAACRQADGPLPPATGDVPNRLQDLERDLANVMKGDKDGPNDLADDLAVFARPDKIAVARDFGVKVAGTVAGSKLDETSAKPLVNHLWLTVSATQLSDRQIDKLKEDLKGTLVSIGVSDASAQTLSTEAANVQKSMRTREKRWYEWF